MSYLLKVVLVVACLSLAGSIIWWKVPYGSAQSQTYPAASGADSADFLEFDAGIVEKDFALHCNPRRTDVKTLREVSKSCGCIVSVGAKPGDRLDLSKAIEVAISVKEKEPGKQAQMVRLVFVDDTSLALKITFDYAPLPHAKERYIIFEPGKDSQSVHLLFPRENNVEIRKVVTANDIEYHVDNSQGSSGGGILVQLNYRRRHPSEAHRGIMLFETSSTRRSSIKVPYLIVDN